MTTRTFDDLKGLDARDLEKYKVEIKPLNPNWHEYANLIIDYGKNKVAVSNRLVPPYVTSNAHGQNVWDGLIDLVKDFKPDSVVDLGCGAGEFLFKIKDLVKEVYGLTIDCGEVSYARDTYGIANVIPADLRDIADYFEEASLDMVVAHKSFDFIADEDRIETMKKIYEVLKPGKWFVHVDDCFRFHESVLPEWEHDKYFTEANLNKEYPTQGKLTVFVKNV
jgi:SAM-dependent methyltransferase